MFKQNLSQFVSSKTNWSAMISIAVGFFGLYTGNMSVADSLQFIALGSAGLGLRDAI